MPTETISKVGVTNTPEVMDYSTWASWEAACTSNLVTADEVWIGEAYDQGDFTAGCTISGITADETRNVVLRCASGHSFKDQPDVRTNRLYPLSGQGVYIEEATADGVFDVGVRFTEFHGLQVVNTNAHGRGICGYNTTTNSWSNRYKVYDCMITCSRIALGRRTSTSGSFEAHNCVIGTRGNAQTERIVYITLAGVEAKMYNCVVARNGSTGASTAIASSWGADMTVENTLIINFAGPGSTWNSGLLSFDYCATDVSAMGGGSTETNCIYDLVAADQVEAATGSFDFRAKSDGDLQAANVIPETTEDILGYTRNHISPWIGPWEPYQDHISKIGVTDTPEVMDYSSWSAWEAACPSDITEAGADRRWIGECYNQGAFTTNCVISGTTVDSTHNFILRCADGHSFKDHANFRTNRLYPIEANGVIWDRGTSGYYNTVLDCGSAYTLVEGIQMNLQHNFYAAAIETNLTTIRDCIIRGPRCAALYRGVTTGQFTMENCVVIRRTHSGSASALMAKAGLGGDNYIKNCTFWSEVGDGNGFVNPTWTGCKLYCENTFFGGAGTDRVNVESNSAEGYFQNCATDRANFTTGTDLGGNLVSLVEADQFENIGTSNLDLRTKPTSDLQAAFVDLTEDIGDVPRNPYDPWIGAWEPPQTVTHKIGVTDTPEVMDFSSISSWEAALPTDLTFAEQNHIGECYNQGKFTAGGAISGITASSTYFVTLKCADGHSFKDHADIRTNPLGTMSETYGVYIEVDSTNSILDVNVQNTVIEGLQASNSNGFGEGMPSNAGTDSAAKRYVVRDCIIESAYNILGKDSTAGQGACLITNCVLIALNEDSGGTEIIYSDQASNPIEIHGTTIIDRTGAVSRAIYANWGGTVTIKNSCIFGFTGEPMHEGSNSGVITATNCATDDADLGTRVGATDCVYNLTATDQFEDYTGPTYDYRCKGGDLFGAGVQDLTNLTYDITGYTRGSDPTIGAFEFEDTFGDLHIYEGLTLVDDVTGVVNLDAVQQAKASPTVDLTLDNFDAEYSLVMAPLTFSGGDAAKFGVVVVTGGPSVYWDGVSDDSIPVGGDLLFRLQLADTSEAGAFTTTVQVPSNDPSSPYTFTINATVNAPPAYNGDAEFLRSGANDVTALSAAINDTLVLKASDQIVALN